MIIAVTLNAALDVTYRVPKIQLHGSHRVEDRCQVAGGKGVNVASVLLQTGAPAVLTGLLGGTTGEQIRENLTTRDLTHDFVTCAGDSRRTVAVVSQRDGDATVFNEVGLQVDPSEWRRFLAHLEALMVTLNPEVIVASGSLPPGVPVEAYREITLLARAHGARSIVDATGQPLLRALDASPEVVKPNRQELAETTGEKSLLGGARTLRARGGRSILVSDGSRGLVLVDPSGDAVRASLPEPLQGNPTGAGDAAVAAVAAHLARGGDVRDALADAVAWSAAAVLHPLAGHVRDADIQRLRAQVRVDPYDPQEESTC